MTKLNTSRTDWDLSPLLTGDDDVNIKAYNDEISAATDDFVKKWQNRQDYTQNPEVLKTALDELEALEANAHNGVVAYFFSLRASIDSANPKVKAGLSQAVEFEQAQANRLLFFTLSIGKIASEKQSEFLESADLKPYRHWLEREFESAKHMLTEPEEKILMLKSTPAHRLWTQMRGEAFAKSERKVDRGDGIPTVATFEEIASLLDNPNKALRDGAAKSLNDILVEHLDTAVAEMNAILTNKKIDDELRGYDRPDRSRLIGDDIDGDSVDALRMEVADRNDIARRFYRLKADVLGLPMLAYHERNLEVDETAQEFTFDQASTMVHAVFSRLDGEFAGVLEQFLSHGQIDVYPRKGKRGGAFCSYGGLKHPTYVMLNYTSKLKDITTLAHELGHGINDEMMRQTQNAFNYGTPMATAEVASTFFEGLVLERLIAEADDEARFAIQMQVLNGNVSSIFRQIAFYNFEYDLHTQFIAKGFLSAGEIGGLFGRHMEAYMGDAVEQSPGSQNWWTFVPHFRDFFYVYSYASGELISTAMRTQAQADKSFVPKVKTFLEGGLSASPKQLFADIGIDITDRKFWQTGLTEIDKLLVQTEELAQKLGKIKAKK